MDTATRAFVEETFRRARLQHVRHDRGRRASWPTTRARRTIAVKPGALGKPVPGVRVEVQRPGWRAAARPDELGEIVVWRRGAWFPTKDRGWVDEDGYFYHAGRADDVIISAGWTMSAVEIEDVLLKHPDVREAAVDRRGRRAARPGRQGLRRERRGRATTRSRASCRSFARTRLSQHEYPRHVAFVPDLPKTPAGKINRKALRDSESRPRAARWSPRMPPDRTTAPTTATTSMFPKITDQGLDDLRRRIGVEITDTLEPWCHEATRDGIRHYAHGIGDDNPLWCDPAYATGTRWGDVIAPPSFLFATSRIISGYVGGLPGVHAMWAGADWTWHLPVRRNDAITARAWLKDLVEHQTALRRAARSSRSITSTSTTSAASWSPAADSWCFRTDRDLAREHGTKYTEVKAQAAQALHGRGAGRGVRALRATRSVRGAVPRYWERRARRETGCPRWRRAR